MKSVFLFLIFIIPCIAQAQTNPGAWSGRVATWGTTIRFDDEPGTKSSNRRSINIISKAGDIAASFWKYENDSWARTHLSVGDSVVTIREGVLYTANIICDLVYLSVPSGNSVDADVYWYGATSSADAPNRKNITLPVYAHWGWGTFQDSLTSADYDFIAQHDVYHIPHESLLLTRFNGLVDSVRTRNPECIFLTYFWVYGVDTTWGSGSSIYKELYDLGIDNDWFTRDAAGALMDGTVDGYVYHFWNPYKMKDGLVESLAGIFKKYLELRDNCRPFVGVYADYIATPYPSWAFGNYDMDWDQDGRAYDYDAAETLKEEGFNEAFAREFSNRFRTVMSDQTCLIVPNIAGNRSATISKFGADWDGAMYEGFQRWYPSETQAQMEQAIEEGYGWLNNTRVNPPLLFWQGHGHDAGQTSEILASMAKNISSYHLTTEANYSLPASLNLGHLVSTPTWSGDTVSAYFSSNTHETYARVVWEQGDGSTNTLPWDFIVVTADSTVLRRNGTWSDYSAWPGY